MLMVKVATNRQDCPLLIDNPERPTELASFFTKAKVWVGLGCLKGQRCRVQHRYKEGQALKRVEQGSIHIRHSFSNGHTLRSPSMNQCKADQEAVNIPDKKKLIDTSHVV
jgi:hypothetical protein